MLKDISFKIIDTYVLLYPSIVQITAASGMSNPSSHKVPHSPLCKSSTRPLELSGPSTSRAKVSVFKDTQSSLVKTEDHKAPKTIMV